MFHVGMRWVRQRFEHIFVTFHASLLEFTTVTFFLGLLLSRIQTACQLMILLRRFYRFFHGVYDENRDPKLGGTRSFRRRFCCFWSSDSVSPASVRFLYYYGHCVSSLGGPSGVSTSPAGGAGMSGSFSAFSFPMFEDVQWIRCPSLTSHLDAKKHPRQQTMNQLLSHL